MAYPVIADTYRTQVILQKDTGLPEDQFVNTFYFLDPGLSQGDAAAAEASFTMLDAFYSGIFGSNSVSIATFLPDYVSAVNYKCYSLDDTGRRFPIAERAATWLPTGTTGAGTLPEEVALCLSFRSGDGPRRRGRVYLGPFRSGNEYVGGRTRPTDTLRQVICDAAVDLLNSTENVEWAVCSPTDAVTTPVISGWVDDAWDTQRSRGAAPTNRYTWNASGVTPA